MGSDNVEFNFSIEKLEKFLSYLSLEIGDVSKSVKFDIEREEKKKLLSLLNKAKKLLFCELISPEEKRGLIVAISYLLQYDNQDEKQSTKVAVATKMIRILEDKYNISGKKLPNNKI